MKDQLTDMYADFLHGYYDCPDRIVLNTDWDIQPVAYVIGGNAGMGQTKIWTNHIWCVWLVGLVAGSKRMLKQMRYLSCIANQATASTKWPNSTYRKRLDLLVCFSSSLVGHPVWCGMWHAQIVVTYG